MLWSTGGASPGEGDAAGPLAGVEVERGAPRPQAILRAAEGLEARGAEIVELFVEVRSPRGTVVMPIHMRHGGREALVEVETRPWEPEVVAEALQKAAAVRASDRAETELGVVGAYPVPDEVAFLFKNSPAAVLQLDLLPGDLRDPVSLAELFRESASARWGVDLDYGLESLPLAEELLLAALEGEAGSAHLTDRLVFGLGYYVGEIVRRNAGVAGSWRAGSGWGEGFVLELGGFDLDPVGKARAFLKGGPEDSVAFFARYALREIEGSPEAGEPPGGP